MSNSGGLLSIGEVNELDIDQFLWLFGNIIEKNSDASKEVFSKKPFQSAIHIVKLYNKFLDSLSKKDQEKVLQDHPDLGSKLTMTEDSIREQESAGIKNLDEDDHDTLIQFNYRYKEKFGFPFVICARENTTDSILENLKNRLENEKEAELKIGIEEVKKIGKLRIFDLVWHD